RCGCGWRTRRWCAFRNDRDRVPRGAQPGRRVTMRRPCVASPQALAAIRHSPSGCGTRTRARRVHATGPPSAMSAGAASYNGQLRPRPRGGNGSEAPCPAIRPFRRGHPAPPPFAPARSPSRRRQWAPSGSTVARAPSTAPVSDSRLPMSRMQFELFRTDGAARRGRLTFPRGVVETPAFMPVGTYGTVKGVLPGQVRELGAQIILGNTFHLFLRPGLEVIEAHGGLHGFTRWDGPILTDSGGFQVFSLAHRRKITEAGVTFAAPTDGSKVFLGPEESMRIQKVLGSDIVMLFDEWPPVQVDGRPVDRRVVERSMELSLRWAERSRRAHEGNDAALFGIVQGGVHPDLRTRSADGLKAIGFDGYAIGGLAVGETEAERNAML